MKNTNRIDRICPKNIIASANMHLIMSYSIAFYRAPAGSSDMVTFFDTSRRKFAKFSRLFRTFHTSLSSVAYDSMEFHLTGPYGRDVTHVKEIPSLFLSTWKVPHATCLCERDALDVSRNFSGDIFANLERARLAL